MQNLLSLESKERNEEKPIFSRGSEILEFKILKKIEKLTRYDPIFISDFKNLGSYQNVRRALDNLAKKGIIRKFHSYPIFYEKVEKF